MWRSVPSPHSQTRCLFTGVQDSDSSRSGTVTYWQSNGQTGEWVGVLMSPWGGVRFCVGFLRVGMWRGTRFTTAFVCLGFLQSVPGTTLVTGHTPFSLHASNIRPLPMLPAFCFLYFKCFLSPIELSHLSTPRGAEKTRQSVWKKQGTVCVLLIKKQKKKPPS